ncbi:MAG: hypothetical protein HY694_07500 [Deltaproteobacteria bacterium]|nr:hypothetical protein [Deltaproteobacteria bacterium]
MDLQKINVKFFVADSHWVPLTAFIHIFNSWIRASDGDYYDIADYSHMHAGPGILLIAHEANISMDNSEERLGLLYNRKQPLQGSNREKLRLIFGLALENCRRIEEDPSLQGKLRFLGNEALFFINDRLLAPNTEETFQAVKPDLDDLARTMYGGADFTLKREADPKKRFSVQIRTPVSFEIRALLKNLEENITQQRKEKDEKDVAAGETI